MAFDVEGYRKAAKEAGFSDEDIQKDIDEETKGIAAKGADADMANVKVGSDFMGIPEWMQPAAGLAAASALLGAGATGLGMKLKDRMVKPEQPAAPRVEPTFGMPDVEAAPQPQSKFTPPQGDVTDVASRPVGEPRLQIGGPRALPAPEVAVPTAAAPAPAPAAPTAPTAPAAPDVPVAPVAPPVEAAPAPVQPKPLSEIEQIRLEKAKFELEAAKAKEARAAEAHAARMAADVKRAEAASQKKSSSGINPQDRQMLESSEKAKLDKAIAANQKAVATSKAPAAAVVPPVAPVVEPVATTAPAAQAAAPEVKAAVPPKGPKWPGGAEGSAVQLFGGTKKNFTPESQAAVELFKDFVGGPLTMPPTGGTINQIDQASKFYEKHTGQPLPRNPEGKMTRIPEEQMQKLHSGIRTELEDAVKGNKLGTLGKGAMAAAALLGLTGAVQAAQKGDFGPLRQAGFDIGGPVALGKLGIAALSRAAGTGFAAATYAGGLNENEGRELARRRYEFEKESQKLGSPLRSVPPPR
jgi:hypothetical protein